VNTKLNDLPQDREALAAMVRSLILEREQQRERVEHESKRANDLQVESLRQTKRAEELYLQNLRLQLELELSAEQRQCPGCGVERKEIGADESWQIEYIPGRFERLHHVRKKYACPGCEGVGENPVISVNFSVYGLRTFNNLRTNFAVEIP